MITAICLATARQYLNAHQVLAFKFKQKKPPYFYEGLAGYKQNY